MKKPVTNPYGMAFSSEAEKQTWDGYVSAQLETARQSPIISRAEADRDIDALIAGLSNVSHSVA